MFQDDNPEARKISAHEFLLRKVFLLLGQDSFSWLFSFFQEELSYFKKIILGLRKHSSKIPVMEHIS